MTYDNDNIFAKILRGELPCEKLYEDEASFAFMDIMPRGNGHCLVIPKAHARNILDISPESLKAVSTTVQKLAKAAKTALDADGVSIQQFNESAAGQVVFHLHFHIIPQFEGVNLRPPANEMEDSLVIKKNADKIRLVLENLA